MSAEAPKQFTEAQLGFQRLLLREKKNDSQPGEGLKRLGLNASIFVGATVADLAESHVIDALVRKAPAFNRMQVEYGDVKGKMTLSDLSKEQHESNWMKEITNRRVRAKNESPLSIDDVRTHLRDAAQHELGMKNAVEFMEEWGSDALFGSIANGWVRLMTGKENAKYVSETSAFIADWFTVWSQVFNDNKLYPKQGRQAGNEKKAITWPLGKDKGFRIKLAYEAADFVNAVNIEALIRMVEEVPALGDGLRWLHEKTDHLIESTVGQKMNTLASKGFLGFHIGKNVEGKHL